jgi:iron complex outermembrane receptor protein
MMSSKASKGRSWTWALYCGAAAAALSAGAAVAQTAPSDSTDPVTQSAAKQAPGGNANLSSQSQTLSEIVVTGTLIRGQAPVGSNLIVVGQDKVQSAGVMTANELLATVPQVSNLFNTVPSRRYAIALNQIQIARPNLRNISPDNASSASTLVLFDGHRVASAGVTQASIDPDLFPTNVIDRVDVVTEGGSATYGADAVGGVINFITRQHFDGVKVGARYGTADGYWTWDANIMAGKDWGSGSAYVSYVISKNDAIYGRDRDYIRGIDFTTGVPTGRSCDLANIIVGGRNFAAPTFAPGTNVCDTTDLTSYVPKVKRQGALASFTQDITDNISIDGKAFWSRRDTETAGPLLASSVTIRPTNPYYQPIGGSPTANQTASFSFSPALGIGAAPTGSKIEEGGAYAEVKANLSKDWQLRTLFNYSQSDSSSFVVGLNPTALSAAGAGTTVATAINPYNIAATDRTLLAALANNQIFAGETKDKLFDFRPVLEGRLFTLPGGDLRLAAGYEFMHDDFQQQTGQNIPIGTLGARPVGIYKRDVHALFGEINVPIVGPGNAIQGINALTLAISGRWDHYSDFGGTFNPKVGATYKPVDWFALRGNWSKSFNAPTPIDQLGSARNTIGAFPFVAFVRPGDNVGFTSAYTVALQGSSPNLQPQTAETWSVGFDADPPFIPGAHVSASYYHVIFKGVLSTPSPIASTLFANFPDKVQTSVTGLTAAQLREFAKLAPNGSAVIEPLIAAGTPVYETVDFRTNNFGDLDLDGLDFLVSYRHPTDFGSVDASISGNVQLKRKSKVAPTAPSFDDLRFNTPRVLVTSTVGANIGDFRAQATWNHTAGYDVQRSSTLPQDHVKDFNTIDLFFKYDVKASHQMLQDLSLTLNLNNVFDANPPLYLASGGPGFNSSAGTFTLGREVLFGVQKKF